MVGSSVKFPNRFAAHDTEAETRKVMTMSELRSLFMLCTIPEKRLTPGRTPKVFTAALAM